MSGNDVNPRALQAALDGIFANPDEVGGAVSVWQDGEEVVSLVAGFRDAARTIPWTNETLVLIWSATKGLSAASVIHALESAGLTPEARVAGLWPEFSAGGKGGVTVADVLSHRAGLAVLDTPGLRLDDRDGVVQALAAQAPLNQTAAAPAYSARTFGFLADEIVRRLAGLPLGEYWRRELGEPLDLDLWIGLPEAENGRVADIIPPKLGMAKPAGAEAFLEAMSRPESLTRRAFSSPVGPPTVSAMNSPAFRAMSLPGMGGIGSARALAKFYSLLSMDGTWRGERIFSPEALKWMTTRIAQGHDEVLCTQTAFSVGFMLDPLDGEGRKLRASLGPSPGAFGHPGAGGSVAFADPARRLAFAWVMNRMEPGALPGWRSTALLRAVYQP